MKLKPLRTKGQTGLNMLVPAFITLGVAFLIGGSMTIVMTEISNSMTVNSTEWNIAKNGSAAMVKLGSFGTIFGIIIAVAVILALIAVAVTAFRTREQ